MHIVLQPDYNYNRICIRIKFTPYTNASRLNIHNIDDNYSHNPDSTHRSKVLLPNITLGVALVVVHCTHFRRKAHITPFRSRNSRLDINFSSSALTKTN